MKIGSLVMWDGKTCHGDKGALGVVVGVIEAYGNILYRVHWYDGIVLSYADRDLDDNILKVLCK